MEDATAAEHKRGMRFREAAFSGPVGRVLCDQEEGGHSVATCWTVHEEEKGALLCEFPNCGQEH